MRFGDIYVMSAVFICLIVSNGMSKEVNKMGDMKISSSAFENNKGMPEKYTCDGSNVNPPLKFENVPANAKSLSLIMDDPDAPMGTFVHWVVWNMDPKTAGIGENTVPKGAVQGINDFRRHNYGGPCPPSGTHRYFFKLYALDAPLDLPPNSAKADVEKAIKGHIVGQSEMIGLYKRK